MPWGRLAWAQDYDELAQALTDLEKRLAVPSYHIPIREFEIKQQVVERLALLIDPSIARHLIEIGDILKTINTNNKAAE